MTEKSIGFNTTTYEFDYFSGSQIGVYIGDILVDDVATIEFQVSQSKKPIYGYASQYYHVLAPGQVIVQGRFTIPFKEAGYITTTLANYVEKFGWGQASTPLQHTKDGTRVLRENIERYMRDPKNQGGDKYEFYKELSGLSDTKWEKIAEIFEDTLWSDKEPGSFEEPNVNMTNVPNEQSSITTEAGAEMWSRFRRGDQYPPFDIWILYGDMNSGGANHTIKKIVSCEIVGQAQSIAVGGEPILEQYEFIGRNLT